MTYIKFQVGCLVQGDPQQTAEWCNSLMGRCLIASVW